MNIQKDVPLSSYTTFKIGGPADFFCVVKNEEDIVSAVKMAKEKGFQIFVLGKGSNLLVSDSGYRGLVIKNEIEGILEEQKKGEASSGDGLKARVTAGAGVNWDSFVEETVSRGLYGLENLSWIPGSVGAAPVQNVGAYGVDAGDRIISVRAFDTEAMSFVEIGHDQCKFEYRDSMFKHNKGRYVISSVTFELDKNGQANIAYRDLTEYFKKKGTDQKNITSREVRDAVIEIRKEKLPDWKQWGTAGSFFKNPVITKEKYDELAGRYPGLPGFPEKNGLVKVSLGWILDKICNAKGAKMGNASIYEKQALVLVAKPGATASEVITLSKNLIESVKEKTGITIEGEVEWVC